MADIQKAIVIGDVHTNLIDPVTGKSVNYKEVTTWYDGTSMDTSKVDGDLYTRKGTKFLRKVIDKDGELFLEKDTVAQLRAMTAREVLYLKAGVFKGVKLNGYYTKGDTPAPIEYYLSDTTGSDDGGSVFEVGGIKLVHDFLNKIHVSYFGVKGDDFTDNTLYYNNIITKAINNSTIEWDKFIYKGAFISNKPLTLEFNHATLKNVDDDKNCIQFSGGITNELTTVLGNPKYGDTSFTVASVDQLLVGDMIFIYDEQKRPSDNLPQINTELLKIKSINGNVITVEDIIRSDQTSGVIKLGKVNSVLNTVKISNVSIVCENMSVGFPILIIGADNLIIDNYYNINCQTSAISIRYCNNITTNNIRVYDTINREQGGRGYGIDLKFSRNFYLLNSVGRKTRHLIDCSSCYNGDIDTVKVTDSLYNEVLLAHNSFGGNFRVRNVTQTGGVEVVGYAYQGLSNQYEWDNTFARDITVDNVTHIIPSSFYVNPFNYIRTVHIGISVYNFSCNNVNTILTGDWSEISLKTDDTIIRFGGVVTGSCTVNKLYSNNISCHIYCNSRTSLSRLDKPEQSVLFVNDLAGNASINIDLGQIENVQATGIVNMKPNSTIVRGFYFNNITWQKSVNLFQYTKLDNSVRVFLAGIASDFTIFNGGIQKSSQIYKTASTGVQLSPFDVENKVVQLNITSTISTHETAFIRNPWFTGETVELYVNDTSGIAGVKAINIPNTNTNIVNIQPMYVKGRYKLTAFYDTFTNTYKWEMSSIGALKSTTANEGIVKQSSASADTATAPSATYTQAEVQAILTELRDLKTKLRTAGILAT